MTETADTLKIRSSLVLAGILLLAFNLRPVAASIGPALGQIQSELGISPTVAGALTALPSLCFAVFGALAPSLAQRIGPHRAIALAYIALIVGQLGRSWAQTPTVFLGLSTVALAGMAVANVLLPSLVRTHFPQHIGLVTSLYSLTLTLGLTLASAATIPLANALGGWRAAFTAGSLVTVAAAIVWLPMLRLPQPPRSSNRHGPRLADVARTRHGWIMALFFALQSAAAYSVFGWLPSIYTAAGLSETEAGLMLGITTGIGVIPAFFLPVYVERVREPIGMMLLLSALLVAGYLGLLLAPTRAPWLWAALLALGLSTFPMILALLGLRSRTPGGIAALSGFVQAVGYLLASAAPFLVGLLREVTGGWEWPLMLWIILAAPMTWLGVLTCRQWLIEDELAQA